MHPSRQGLDGNSGNEVVLVDDEPLLHNSLSDEENESFCDALDSSSEVGILLTDILSHRQGAKNGGSDSASSDQPQCRICLDTEGGDLIAPCKCKGTQKYVHRSCLDNWRAAKEGFAFSHCTECKTPFHLRANVPPDRWWLTLKFQFLVLRDHAAVFVAVQLVVASLAFLVYRFNGDELREMFGYEHHPYGFYALAEKKTSTSLLCMVGKICASIKSSVYKAFGFFLEHYKQLLLFYQWLYCTDSSLLLSAAKESATGIIIFLQNKSSPRSMLWRI